jgi:large subunit ribosomal protein L18
MAFTVRYKVKKRRRRSGRTNYNKRLEMMKSEKPRLVVRITNKNVVAQIVQCEPAGDKTLVNTTALELKKLGWNGSYGNSPSAYLTGALCASKALKKGISEAILDIGLHTPVSGSNPFAVLRGAVDAGMKIAHSEDVMPEDARVTGRLIADYRKKSPNFEEVRMKITGGAKFVERKIVREKEKPAEAPKKEKKPEAKPKEAPKKAEKKPREQKA